MKLHGCACSVKSRFTIEIDYKKGIFKQYSGIVIAKCRRCGLLKTIVLQNQFNPKESQGEFYEQNNDKFRKIFSPLVKTLKKFKDSGDVLDVGCSSGILMEELQRVGYQVFGIEPNKKAYQFAKRKFGKRVKNLDTNHFFKKNKQKFDIIIYNHVLEHIPDINKEFEFIRRHLKKEALLIVGVPNVNNLIYKIRGERWESLMPREHIWHFADHYMKNLLKTKGFNVLKVEYSNQNREDYSMLKRIYFLLLRLMNLFFGTGEAVLFFTQYIGEHKEKEIPVFK